MVQVSEQISRLSVPHLIVIKYVFIIELISDFPNIKLSGIRDNIISKSMCVCGAQNVLADDLLPNNTVRDTINRIMEANNSGDNKGSAFQIQGMHVY